VTKGHLVDFQSEPWSQAPKTMRLRRPSILFPTSMVNTVDARATATTQKNVSEIGKLEGRHGRKLVCHTQAKWLDEIDRKTDTGEIANTLSHQTSDTTQQLKRTTHKIAF
jgi:hypothetical protein